MSFRIVVVLASSVCLGCTVASRNRTAGSDSAAANEVALDSTVRSPERVAYRGGVMLPETDSGEFAIMHFGTARGEELWLRRVVERRSGRPLWEEIASLALPEIGTDEILVLSNCRQNDVLDPELVAVTKYEDAEEFRMVRRAWRADRQGREFREVQPDGIVCINEGYGA